MNICKLAGLDETFLKNNAKLIPFSKYLHVLWKNHGREEESYQKREDNSHKKVNDVWKNDASGYWPVSVHLY